MYASRQNSITLKYRCGSAAVAAAAYVFLDGHPMMIMMIITGDDYE